MGCTGVWASLIDRDGASAQLWIGDVIVDIQGEGNGLLFLARGDARGEEDAPLSAAVLAGKVVLTVPKVGWVHASLRRALARPKARDRAGYENLPGLHGRP
jgi:hypothetical protein